MSNVRRHKRSSVMPRSLHISHWFAVWLLLADVATAQQGAFVYEVPDGVFESGVRYSARLEEVQQSGDGTVMRFTFTSESQHLRSIVLFRGVCRFLNLKSKKTAELLKHGDDKETILVQTPEALSAMELSDRRRVFVTQDICAMSQPAPK